MFTGLPTATVRVLQRGAPDSYGHPPERHTSDGEGNPCRHCLRMIEEGAAMLVLAHRPFERSHAYAETRPIFLHARECEPFTGEGVPEIAVSPRYLLRGYGADERIVYGTGGVVEREALAERAAELPARDDVAFVDMRSASNNCWQARVVD